MTRASDTLGFTGFERASNNRLSELPEVGVTNRARMNQMGDSVSDIGTSDMDTLLQSVAKSLENAPVPRVVSFLHRVLSDQSLLTKRYGGDYV